MNLSAIHTDKAPAPAGAYSQAVRCGDFIFVSGQLPRDPATGELVMGRPAEQIRQVIKNVQAILEAAGSDLNHVVKVTLLVRNIGDWDEINEMYHSMFTGAVLPARTIEGNADIHFGLAVEMDAIACIK